MVIAASSDPAVRIVLDRWRAREPITFVPDFHAAFARARSGGARVVILDYDQWLPDTPSEFAFAVGASPLLTPILIVGSPTRAFVESLPILASVRASVDVVPRRMAWDLAFYLQQGFDRGPVTGTIPILRELAAHLSAEDVRLVGALLVLGDKRGSAIDVAGALGMSPRSFFGLRDIARLPEFAVLRGMIFALHVHHWIHVRDWDASLVASFAGFASGKELTEYLKRTTMLTYTQIADMPTNGLLLARIVGWFSNSR